MEKFYSIMKKLPTELLLSDSSSLLEDVKYSRWSARDIFLQISQSPFAAANGIGSDHLFNFLDLQDALIVKLLIKKVEDFDNSTEKEEFSSNEFINREKIKICSLIQLVLTESPKLIEFLFAYPENSQSYSPLKLETLKLLIHNCPALFNCTHLFKDFIHMDSYKDNKFYYWNFIVLLMEKYPTQVTFELAKEVVTEIDLSYETFENSHEIRSIKNILKIISKVFPMIDLSSVRNKKK